MINVKFTAVALAIMAAAGFAMPQNAEADESTGDPGHIRGIVTEVNYSRGRLELRSNQGQRYVLHVMPSTTISSSNHDADDYHALTDIHRGSVVDVDMSRRGNRYEAQTINLDHR